jgi:outer membrane protein
MKKTILFLLLTVVSLAVSAQDAQPKDSFAFKFGYLSYDSVMVAMPEYAELKTNMAQLREQYEAEQKRVENDFNKKYEEFLDGQASFPKTILQKRQSELQEMLDKSIDFKKQSQKMLSDAEAGMMEAVKTTINMAVKLIAQERGYAFVLNTDKEAVTFINPALGEDITEAVKQLLNEDTKTGK